MGEADTIQKLIHRLWETREQSHNRERFELLSIGRDRQRPLSLEVELAHLRDELRGEGGKRDSLSF